MKLEKIRYRVSGMHCASCVARVENALRKVGGVESAAVNLAMEEALIEVDHDRFDPRTVESVEGFALCPATSDAPVEPASARQGIEVAVAVALAAIVMAASMNGLPWVAGCAAALSVVVLGRSFLRGAIVRARYFAADMDTLVALGTWTALGWSWLRLVRGDGGPYWFDGAAMITAFVLFGRWLEARARHRTGAAVRSLLSLAPQQARVERDGDVVEIAAADLQVGDICRVRPGERLAAGQRTRCASFSRRAGGRADRAGAHRCGSSRGAGVAGAGAGIGRQGERRVRSGDPRGRRRNARCVRLR